uniref:Thy-1 membrane glycoprotein n=1 Tax=Meleagris gallopavo TaxID=9103 RepID=G1MUK3_MELGA
MPSFSISALCPAAVSLLPAALGPFPSLHRNESSLLSSPAGRGGGEAVWIPHLAPRCAGTRSIHSPARSLGRHSGRHRHRAHLSLAATSGQLILEKMNPTVSIAVILTVLQAAHCQMIRDLSACLLGQSLRVDCRYENKTSNPLTYEFSLTKDNRKHIIQSTINVAENVYRNRANVTVHKNLVCLYLHSFTTSDEGVYVCELKATNDYTGNQIKNITVIKDKLEKCAGFSLLIQNTSWLLLLLLSLPLLQAVDFVSL